MWYNCTVKAQGSTTGRFLSVLPTLRYSLPRHLWPSFLFALGGLFLLAAAAYAGYVAVNTWLIDQDRFLVSDAVAQLSGRTQLWADSGAEADSARMPLAPVQIRIPAIGVERSIVELPVVADRSTGTETQDVESLLQSGRRDLVGHWRGSAYPGMGGNTILVGHNYGYRSNGVFFKLGNLKVGQEIHIVDEAGLTFTYQVKTVQRVRWQKRDNDEILQHWEFLSLEGPERLTLVTCSGSNAAPFPERLYVVAEPVR
jgi:LPXTG-site transpeptidase (sortase) family protein